VLSECLSLHNVGLCCGRFHKMQVSGRAVPKRYDRARPLACFVNAAVGTKQRYGARTLRSSTQMLHL